MTSVLLGSVLSIVDVMKLALPCTRSVFLLSNANEIYISYDLSYLIIKKEYSTESKFDYFMGLAQNLCAVNKQS